MCGCVRVVIYECKFSCLFFVSMPPSFRFIQFLVFAEHQVVIYFSDNLCFFLGGQGRVVVGGFVGGVWNAGCKSVHFSIGKVTKTKRDKRDVTLLTTR